MKEEKRKIQMTGGSTLTISLPISWAREVGINQGDEVTLRWQEDKSILLTAKPKKKQGMSRAVIKLCPGEKPEDILRLLIAHYLVGYDIINLVSQKGFNTQDRKWIKDTVRQRLMGLEVVEESGDELILQSLLNYEELNLEKAIQRISGIIKSIQKDSIRALQGDIELARDVIQRDDDVDRFYLLIVRQLKAALRDPELAKKIGIRRPRDCMAYRLIIKSMERIADHAEKIARDAIQIGYLNPEIYTEISGLSELVHKVFDLSLESLSKRDLKTANRAIAESQEVANLATMISNRIFKTSLSITEQTCLRSVLESLRRMVEYGADIAEIVINMGVKEPEV
ncbi:MAG: phosphate uptake regulator PhoU [Methanocellales archaeon]|nr:phosphate uptake regulator PhoU [Methanocellales archaeon]MDD3292399.1 phosphate uptake regulator PhoU [Methanocellales archaeon]MDD5235989.1 phosphate uptake regulator PhoU [Methanocellales archaeon]MDD5485296.1 phosphate uptake regulator PhoU [Methanocellales archaeon]